MGAPASPEPGTRNPQHRQEALRPVAGRTRPEEARISMVFALLAVAIALSVSGELMLKMGMNRYASTFGALDLSPATLVPTLFRVFTQPLVFLGFVFVFSASIFWLAVLS